MGISLCDPDDDSKRIPCWVDYTQLVINDKSIFDKLTPVCHDKPYKYWLDAKAGEEIKIQIKWLPHRSNN